MLNNEIKASKVTGTMPTFALAGATSVEHVFPEEQRFEASEAPTLDACRNETEAMQVVVLPFR